MAEIASDELVNIKCCICAEKNTIKEADKYCIECKDYYCLACVDAHRIFPTLKGHKILDKDDFRTLGPGGSLPSFPTQRCSLHPTKVVDMFCKQHDEVACASCIALSHRNCTSIHSIPEEVDSLCVKTNLKDVEKKINELQGVVLAIKQDKEEQHKKIKKSLSQAVNAVKALKKELQTLLDNTEQETISEIIKEVRLAEGPLEAEIKEAENVMDSLNELHSQLMKSEGNKAQEFVCVKSLNKLTEKVAEQDKMQPSWIIEISPFKADQTIKEFLQKIQTFGKVETLKKHVPKTIIYKVKQQREIPIKLPYDKNICWIGCSCITDEGSLLLADYGNNKLKRMDMATETITDSTEIEANQPEDEFYNRLFGVCQISNTEVAVTFLDEFVQFVSLKEKSKMTATRSLTMMHECKHVTHHDGKLYISDYDKRIYIHDMGGRLLHKVSQDASGSSIFKSVRKTAVSDDGDKIYVTDYENGLITLDAQGNYLSTQTELKDLGLVGICTFGSILFVGGYDSCSVIQLGQDFKILSQLAKLESAPLSICFDHHKKWLYVTQKNYNNVIVLELE